MNVNELLDQFEPIESIPTFGTGVLLTGLGRAIVRRADVIYVDDGAGDVLVHGEDALAFVASLGQAQRLFYMRIELDDDLTLEECRRALRKVKERPA